MSCCGHLLSDTTNACSAPRALGGRDREALVLKYNKAEQCRPLHALENGHYSEDVRGEQPEAALEHARARFRRMILLVEAGLRAELRAATAG